MVRKQRIRDAVIAGAAVAAIGLSLTRVSGHLAPRSAEAEDFDSEAPCGVFWNGIETTETPWKYYHAKEDSPAGFPDVRDNEWQEPYVDIPDSLPGLHHSQWATGLAHNEHPNVSCGKIIGEG